MILLRAEGFRKRTKGEYGEHCRVIKLNGILWLEIGSGKRGSVGQQGLEECAGRTRACVWRKWRPVAVFGILVIVLMLTTIWSQRSKDGHRFSTRCLPTYVPCPPIYVL